VYLSSESDTDPKMPRRPTSDEATRAARFFLESFIVKTDSQDHILPKNDTFSPFSGFCRVFPQFAKKKDGGSATDGVSRAAFNKICLEYFEEGMRKPARNGNPGALEANLAQQRRHFLRGRWRDPGVASDVSALAGVWSGMAPDHVAASAALLEDFARWKPGPAGRGGERQSRKRGGSDDESDESEGGAEIMPGGAGKRRCLGEPLVHAEAEAQGVFAAPGALELLCQVASHASSVEELSPSSASSLHLPAASSASSSSASASSSLDPATLSSSALAACRAHKGEASASEQSAAATPQCSPPDTADLPLPLPLPSCLAGHPHAASGPAAPSAVPAPFASLYR